MDYWHTQDGQEIKLADMTEQHLTNTIRYMKRRFDSLSANAPKGRMVHASIMGELAEEHLEQELDEMEAHLMKVRTALHYLEAEASKRVVPITAQEGGAS